MARSSPARAKRTYMRRVYVLPPRRRRKRIRTEQIPFSPAVRQRREMRRYLLAGLCAAAGAIVLHTLFRQPLALLLGALLGAAAPQLFQTLRPRSARKR